MPVERRVASRDDRPCVRVGGRLARKVPRVEIGYGGLELVDVVHHVCRTPLVGIDLDDNEKVALERFEPLVVT